MKYPSDTCAVSENSLAIGTSEITSLFRSRV